MQILLEQLTARFGRVPATVKARVEAADEATLLDWAVRVLTAPTLASLFDDEAAPAAPTRRAPASPPARRRAAARKPARRS